MKINIGQLKWQSRRSILELDILFNNFINSIKFNELSQEQLEVYKLILQMEDSYLLVLLQNQIIAPDAQIQEIINYIKAENIIC